LIITIILITLIKAEMLPSKRQQPENYPIFGS
jgi:hypothetical protein